MRKLKKYKFKLSEPIVKKSIVPGMKRAVHEIEFREARLGDMIKSSLGVRPDDYALIAMNYLVLLNQNGLEQKDFEDLNIEEGNRLMEFIGNLISGGRK